MNTKIYFIQRLLHLFIMSIIVFLFQCGSNLNYIESEPLARPTGISVSATSNREFTLKYFIQNQENNFNGYNLYISKTKISDSDPNNTISPITFDGELPSFRHNSSNFNTDKQQSVKILFFSKNKIKFEEDTYYYFILTAHSINNLNSLPSNEVMVKTID